jgi:hypothetical protein
LQTSGSHPPGPPQLAQKMGTQFMGQILAKGMRFSPFAVSFSRLSGSVSTLILPSCNWSIVQLIH